MSGEGQWVQTSLLEVADLHARLPGRALSHEQARCPARPATTIRPAFRPAYSRPPTDFINIATTGPAIWKRFCEAAGAPDLIEREEYRTARDRSANRAALNAEIAAKLRQRSTADWLETLNAAGVPCGPINTIDQVFADRQVRHLGIAQSVTKTDGTAVPLIGQPVTLARTPAAMQRAAPDAGEHTDEILAEFGYAADEIADFRARGLI